VILFLNNKKFKEYIYHSEEELEREIINNSSLFFGKDSIYIDAKRKIESKALGGSIPDGFLFDLSDIKVPEFYIVEVELKSHDFYRHIFPQITKFFAFFKNKRSQNRLIEQIFNLIDNNTFLKNKFRNYLGEREIYKFIKDTIENSQNILLILNDQKEEIPEIINTYEDTWGKMVKVLILKKYINQDEQIYTLDPDFESIEFGELESLEELKEETSEYSEEYHLENVDEKVKNAYYLIKEEILLNFDKVKFNPTKRYISILHKRNIAYFKFRKKKIRLVVTLPYEKVKRRIKKHYVKKLSEGVQRFWGSPSCEIYIENDKNLDEIIELLKIKLEGTESIIKMSSKRREEGVYDEKYWLSYTSTKAKKGYLLLKKKLLSLNKHFEFRIKKRYIGILTHNRLIATLIFRKDKIKMHIFVNERIIRKKIRRHKILKLSKGLLEFYHRPATEIIIEDDKNINELVSLIKFVANKYKR